eukprot:CAMPEP_0116014680 /NCGR_PEP_ID=MMETSP0321-20121206/6399_1 /TAXON_ID=163516 /ORGANISM="Leptocylindrus danicus var. danicus, Strain B650" /LENGTH=96 /DNA_ID=CAMNT_0003484333 /DNA_START=588 /DNA_END=874 /DNA_ORIENTATION=-
MMTVISHQFQQRAQLNHHSFYHDPDDISIQSDHTDIDHDQGAQIIGGGDDMESIEGGHDAGDDVGSIDCVESGIERESEAELNEESIPSLNIFIEG